MSTIHSVRKSKRLSEKMYNNKPDAKISSEPEAVAPPAGQPLPAAPSASSAQPRTSTQSRRAQQPADTAETRRRRKEEHHGYSREEPRPRFEGEHKSTPHLNPRGAEFESIRLATRTENPLSYKLRRVISSASATMRRWNNRHTSMTPTRTTETLAISNTGCMNHHGVGAYGHRGHTP